MYKELQIIHIIKYQFIVIPYMITDISFNLIHLEKRLDVMYDHLKIIITDHQTVIR